MTDGEKSTTSLEEHNDEVRSNRKKPKRRLSASEYQKYILMEQQSVEVDAEGNAHIVEPDMLLRMPSWLAISSDSTTDEDENDVIPSNVYVRIEQSTKNTKPTRAQAAQNENGERPYLQPPSRCQRWRAEIWDLLRELIHYGKNKSLKKKILTVIVCVSSILVFADLLFFGNIQRWLQSFILWMGDHIVEGIFAFVGLFVITTLVFIPPSILTFGAGYICAEVCGLLPGIAAATMACFVGSVIGAVIAFFRARYMMRDLIQLFARRYSIIRATDKAIKRHGFRVMLLLRLCPLIPFHALNYIGGITAVRWEAFTASMVGMLPIQILTVSIGATTESLVNSASGNEDQQLVHVVLICSGLAFLVIAFCIILYFARKELKAELEAAAMLESGIEMEYQPSQQPQQQADEEEDLTELGIERTIHDEEWWWLWV